MGAMFGLVGVYALGVWFMSLGEILPFVIGGILISSTLASAFWIFSEEITALRQGKLRVRDASKELIVSACSVLVECVAAFYIGVHYWPYNSPLNIQAKTGQGNYPLNQPMGEITWNPARYADLWLTVHNASNDNDYVDATFAIESPLLIHEMTEMTRQACTFAPEVDLTKMGHIGTVLVKKINIPLVGLDGKTYIAPITDSFGPIPNHVIAADKRYRARCAEIPSTDSFSFLAAVSDSKGNAAPPEWVDVDAVYYLDGIQRRKRFEFVCSSVGDCVPRHGWLYRQCGSVVAAVGRIATAVWDYA